MRTVTRQDIAAILASWQCGDLDAERVYDWANALYGREDVTYADWYPSEQDGSSVTNEILGQLDYLDGRLVTADDVPIFLKALATPVKATESAIAAIGSRTRRNRL